jgi:hypothetical protein
MDSFRKDSLHGGVTIRSLPSGWNNLLAKLGITQNRGNRRKVRDMTHRALRMESLEQRQMLTVFTVNTTVDENDGVGVSWFIVKWNFRFFALAGSRVVKSWSSLRSKERRSPRGS